MNANYYPRFDPGSVQYDHTLQITWSIPIFSQTTKCQLHNLLIHHTPGLIKCLV